ncbi:MAG: UDP-N-acetylmuramoyl-L-alanyl-D-glutamate--2,6-diaminopimelate ligase [Oscillospiraceae bacterium]|jgi:UDP-N-acetylmuramoyl-L-alanyl-D-glutamate--2,6-diaminopimelate ligase|nr:UDP-N-acetylmuramoyl-L-alanyl-D-glutamate--2,6-diaminopimelate ligase [Oscillospiraceae bacterium]
MKLQMLLEAIALLDVHAPLDLEITGVSYDSRTTKAGELFVAVTGFESDGHDYIATAVSRGAAAVLCERDIEADIAWVRVESTRKALAQLGVNWYGAPAKAMQMIGITGTNGKTSVTYFVKTLLEQCLHAKVGLIGTNQNLIGNTVLETERTTPESFALQGLLAQMRDAGCTHVVMEVSSHALALHRVDGIGFQVGAFSNLTKDHLDFHKTMESYQAAKSRLFRLCERGVFNLDDPAAKQLIAEASCAVYTVGNNADLQAENVILHADCVQMQVREKDACAALRVGVPGRFTVSNALLAIGIARQLGISLQDAAQALGRAQGVKGRIEVVPTQGKPYTVLIDYAHTPDGLENILRSVRDFCKGRVILVFGCGGDRDKTKRPIMGKIAAKYADFVIVTSDNPRTEQPMAIINHILGGMRRSKTPYVIEENRRRAIAVALRNARKDDILILAGKGHETYQIFGKEKRHFDEREEVFAYLREEEHGE